MGNVCGLRSVSDDPIVYIEEKEMPAFEQCNSLEEFNAELQKHLTEERIEEIKKTLGKGTKVAKPKKKAKKYSKHEDKPLLERKQMGDYLKSMLTSIVTQLTRIQKQESESMQALTIKLQEKTNELDNVKESQMAIHREKKQNKDKEVERKQSEIDTLTNQNNKLRNDLNKTIEGLQQEKEKLKSELTESTAMINKLQQQVTDETENRQKLQGVHVKEMQEKEDKVKQLKNQVNNLQDDSNKKASELDIIRRDLEDAREQNSKWEEDLTESESKVKVLKEGLKEKEKIASQLEYDKTEMKSKIAFLQKGVEDSQHQVTQLKQQLNHVTQQRDEDIQECNNIVREKDKQIQHLSTKLSAEMSTKLAADESNVENVSIKNRPMNVAEEYQMACTDQWLDAKQMLDETEDVADHVRMQLLCKIIQVAEEEAKAMYETINGSLEMLQTDAINYVSQHDDPALNNVSENGEEEKTPKQKTRSTSHLSKELANSFSDILRITADAINITPLVERVIKAIHQLHQQDSDQGKLWHKNHTSLEVATYLKTMVRICWKMVIQRPQMKLICSEKYLGKKQQDLSWDSNKPDYPDAVLITVYPMLYHGKSLMAKGKVCLLDPRKHKGSTED